MKSLEQELKESKLCNLTIEYVYGDGEMYCVMFMKNKEGKAQTHFITQSKKEVKRLIEILSRYVEGEVASIKEKVVQ